VDVSVQKRSRLMILENLAGTANKAP